MDLREKAKSMNASKGIEFMGEREKGETKDLLNKVVTIRDYDFINGTDGEYVVFIVDEDKKHFFFGGKVITDNLRAFNDEEKEQIKANGLPSLFGEKVSKQNKKTYTSVEFYPNDVDELPF